MSTSATATGTNFEVNGASLQVEEQGQCDPIVLVHPGLTSGAAYAGAAPRLAEHFRVITIDTRGNGRSTNPGGELSQEAIAGDTAAVIERLGLDRPAVGGWSDGGHVALELGLRHPGRARALIVGAAFADFRGQRAHVRAWFCVGPDGRVDAEASVQPDAETVLPMMRHFHPGGEEQVRTIV